MAKELKYRLKRDIESPLGKAIAGTISIFEGGFYWFPYVGKVKTKENGWLGNAFGTSDPSSDTFFFEEIKQIGITADNYKLARFRKELDKKGYTDRKETPFTADTTLISVYVTIEKVQNSVKEIHNLCKHVELHFKQGN